MLRGEGLTEREQQQIILVGCSENSKLPKIYLGGYTYASILLKATENATLPAHSENIKTMVNDSETKQRSLTQQPE